MTRNLGRGKYDRSKTASERTAERHELLLDLATEVFAERGFANTRIEDICERAGVSRRTLYEHFDSTLAILTEIYDRAVRINFTAIVEKMAAVSDPIERIHAGCAAYYETIAANPAAAIVVFEQYRMVGPAQLAQYELNTSRYAMLMMELLAFAFAQGRLRRAPDELTVYALIKATEAVGTRAVHRKEIASLATVAPRVARLVIDAHGGEP